MGSGASTTQAAAAANHSVAAGPDPAAPDGASEARRQGLALGATLAKTVAHFFPEFHDWLKEVRDRRDPDLTTFTGRFLLWMGLMLFLMRLGSRRRLDSELDSPEALINLNSLATIKRRWPTTTR